MRVLHVDDDAVVRELVRIGMGHYGGHDVWSFEDGPAALDFLRSEPVDLIVSDVMMPRMNGQQFVEALREEALSTAPVVFLTSGFGARYASLDALEPLAILNKPFHPLELADAIGERLADRAEAA